MNSKEVVEKIYNEKAKCDSNSQDLARTLDVLSKTVFGNVNRFVFELLQNADDSSIGTETNIEVQFRILDNYLIFSHNGAHFTELDVLGISSIGNRSSQKDQSIEKTGYKGIGFKSVFGTSDYAHIVSSEYSFRFDKNHSEFNNGENYPWQVIPIWTEKPNEEVTPWLNLNHVNTIIQIKNREEIKKEITKVFSDCQILLFLRKVSSVTLFEKENSIFHIASGKNNPEIVTLYNNSQVVSSWITKSYNLIINDSLKQKLQDISDVECPQKLKDATQTKLTFAAMVTTDKILPIKNSVIYSYLPTQSHKEFPYLINGDFLTNAERTDLLPNIWNQFLFEQIAVKQLDWFAELGSGQFRYEVLKLLKEKYSIYQISSIDKSYNTSIESAAKKVAFLPMQKRDGQLITIGNSIVDIPLFSSIFEPKIISDYLKLTGINNVVKLEVLNQGILKTHGGINFSFEQILDLIKKKAVIGINSSINLIVFFFNSTLDGKNNSWLTSLSDTEFIGDQNNVYKTPREIFLPLISEENNTDFNYADLSFINHEILEHFKKYPSVIEWLRKLGVKEPTDLQILNKAIIPLIKADQLTENKAVNITRFIFKIYNAKLLSDKEYDDLKNLRLIGSDGFSYPHQCYLSDGYNPEKKLSGIIPNANFLSNLYPETTDDIDNWKSFFKRIGVKENITIDIIEDKIERQTFTISHPYAGAYFIWLEVNDFFPEIYHIWRASGQHFIQNFTAIDFRLHLADLEFSKFFWGKMLQSWEEFRAKCSNSKYYYRGGHHLVPSFVEYYVKNHESIPCTNGRCYMGTSVFAPTLKSVIGSFFPVADFPVSTTAEQIKFFGFKRSVSIAECLQLLDLLQNSSQTADSVRQIILVYEQLINKSAENDPATKELIQNWRNTAQVLTLNNTFQPIINLYCFNIYSTESPVNSDRFIKLPNRKSNDEIEALCSLLEIPIITFDMLDFVSDGVTIDTSLQKALLDKVLYLSIIYSQNSGEKLIEFLPQVRHIINSTIFYQAENLNLVYKSDGGEVIFDKKIDAWKDISNNLYYIGKWNSPLTLYGLSSSICALLNCKDMERELALILQLSHEEIHEWLKQKGYSIEELEILEIQPEIFSNVAPVVEENEADKYEGIDIGFEESFIAQVRPDEIDYTVVKPQLKNYNETPIEIKPNFYTPLTNKKAMIDIGRWSEEYIYQYLKNNSEIYTEINWVNEQEESYLPYDFEVVENGINKTFEVKGTPSLTKEEIYISSDEWRILFEKGVNYSLFRIYGAGTENHSFDRIDDLRSLIQSGLILPSPIMLQI